MSDLLATSNPYPHMAHHPPDAESSLEPTPSALDSEDCPSYVEPQTWRTFRDQLCRLPYDAVVVSDDLILSIDRTSHRVIIEAVRLLPNRRPAIAIVDIDGRDAPVATIRPVEWLDESTGDFDTEVIPHSGTKELQNESSMRLVTNRGFRLLTNALEHGQIASRGDDIEF